jgi:superfamily II DNA or RNA helicase
VIELRPYQVAVIAAFVRLVAAGVKRIILVAPTGSGKTLIAGSIIKTAVAAWRTVLVLSHRREINGADIEEAVRPRHTARHHPSWILTASA